MAPPTDSVGGGGTSAAQTFTITAATPEWQKPQRICGGRNSFGEFGRAIRGVYPSQNDHTEIFLRDTCEGAASGCKAQTAVLSAASDGHPGNDDSNTPSISANGRYVAFSSAATNLVENAPQAGRFICGTLVRVRTVPARRQRSCFYGPERRVNRVGDLLPSISATGRFVAFLAVTPSHTSSSSAATNAKIAATGRYSCATPVWGRQAVRRRRRAFRCNLVMAHPPPRSEQVRRLARAARASHWRDKRRRFSHDPWPSTIAFFWRLQKLISDLGRV